MCPNTCTSKEIKTKQTSYVIKLCDISGASFPTAKYYLFFCFLIFPSPGIQGTPHMYRKDRKGKQDGIEGRPQKDWALASCR